MYGISKILFLSSFNNRLDFQNKFQSTIAFSNVESDKEADLVSSLNIVNYIIEKQLASISQLACK